MTFTRSALGAFVRSSVDANARQAGVASEPPTLPQVVGDGYFWRQPQLPGNPTWIADVSGTLTPLDSSQPLYVQWWNNNGNDYREPYPDLVSISGWAYDVRQTNARIDATPQSMTLTLSKLLPQLYTDTDSTDFVIDNLIPESDQELVNLNVTVTDNALEGQDPYVEVAVYVEETAGFFSSVRVLLGRDGSVDQANFIEAPLAANGSATVSGRIPNVQGWVNGTKIETYVRYGTTGTYDPQSSITCKGSVSAHTIRAEAFDGIGLFADTADAIDRSIEPLFTNEYILLWGLPVAPVIDPLPDEWLWLQDAQQNNYEREFGNVTAAPRAFQTAGPLDVVITLAAGPQAGYARGWLRWSGSSPNMTVGFFTFGYQLRNGSGIANGSHTLELRDATPVLVQPTNDTIALADLPYNKVLDLASGDLVGLQHAPSSPSVNPSRGILLGNPGPGADQIQIDWFQFGDITPDTYTFTVSAENRWTTGPAVQWTVTVTA